MLRAGLMDRRIELRHAEYASPDSNGQRVASWDTTYATVWARKEEISGREYFAAETKQAENTVRFTIRYRSDVLATDRLTCEERDYEVIQTSEGGRRESLIQYSEGGGAMSTETIRIKQSEIRKELTIHVKVPRLLGVRLLIGVLMFRLGALIAGA